uniref:DnaJ heat shock protein family (Hsp40) member C14 n=2 Tax=Latimeria chalumnae TaxID=7897 RepID=H3BHB8_LATCH
MQSCNCNDQSCCSESQKDQVDDLGDEEEKGFQSGEGKGNGGSSNDDEDDRKTSDDVCDESSVLSSGRKGGRRQRNRSATKNKEDLRETLKREGGRFQSSVGRNKPARKRNHPDGRQKPRTGINKQLEELFQSCISSFKIVVELILFVIHKCGEYVETGGKMMYSCCQLEASDLDSFKASAQALSQWVLFKVKHGFEKLKVSCFSSMEMTFGFLKMLFALFFLVLVLFVGCLRVCWRYVKAGFSIAGGKLTSNARTAHLLRFLQVSFLHRGWTLFKESRTWQRLPELFKNWKMWILASDRLRTDEPAAASYTGSPTSGRYQPDQEVERLLGMADIPEEDLNPFQVLRVEMTASDMELKKAYRQLAVLVHPDKNKHPRAEEAFKVLRAAWDIVSNPEKRKEYEIKRMAESELARSMNEFLTKLQDDLKEAMNTMMCSKCQGKHKRFEMDRAPTYARYCSECNKMHPAEEGDFWAESSMLGLKITYFAMMDGKVYDITEWAGCQRVGISPDTHRVPYHISFGNRNSGNGGRQRTNSESGPASAADLQDFINRMFQGAQGQMPNGGFFNPPPYGSTTSSPNPPRQDTAPKGDWKQKRRKKFKRPFPR